MTAQEILLLEASEWVRHELEELLGHDYQIVRITTETFHEADEDLHNIHVYLEPGHPKLDWPKLLEFHVKAYKNFTDQGIESPPTIIYGQEEPTQ